VHQWGDILTPIAQRGNSDYEGAQPEVEASLVTFMAYVGLL
jgi:hypothetical protein